MAKEQKSYRFEKKVVNDLDKLVNFYNTHMQEFSVKKAYAADILSILIDKEIELLRKEGYNI